MLLPERWKIFVYDAPSGRRPFSDWVDALTDLRGKYKIRVLLDRLRAYGPGDSKFLGDGLMELRIHFGPGYRVYFAYIGQQDVLLLWGGIKDTQIKDIEKAKIYLQDFLQRRDNRK